MLSTDRGLPSPDYAGVERFTLGFRATAHYPALIQTASSSDELFIVNAYFSHFHSITPVVKEVHFNAQYARRFLIMI